MKQHITENQFNELSSEQVKKLHEYISGKIQEEAIENGEFVNYEVGPRDLFLSIGPMIEFIGDSGMKEFVFQNGDVLPKNNVLCDELWNFVKLNYEYIIKQHLV